MNRTIVSWGSNPASVRLENERNNNMFGLLSCYFNIISLLNWVIVCIRLRLSIKHVKLDEMKNNSKTNPSSYQNTLCCSYQKQQNHSNRSLNRQSIVFLCISASFYVFLCNCKRCKFTKKLIGDALWVHKQCIDADKQQLHWFYIVIDK